MARRTSKFVNIEAESDDEYESGEFSEDMDNLPVVTPRAKSYSDFAREMEAKYIGSESEEESHLESEEGVEAPGQLRLLPTARSPLLFLVRCKMGKEREIAARIQEQARAAGEESEVYSVVQKEGLKGYLYIEAHKKQAVVDVLAPIRNVGRNRLSVVPFREMVEAITYGKEQTVGEYARVKGGKYRGDLVQVLENYEDTVEVKVLPRINDAHRLFDPGEHRGAVKRDNGYIFNRDFYVNGFLIKTVLKNSLDFDVEPTFSELRSLGLDSGMEVNDTIRVRKGDLRSAIGRVISICGRSAVVQDASTGEKYELNVDDLEKHYEVGESVSYNGINGVVLAMEGSKVVVGMNNFTEEIKVPATALKAPVSQRKPVGEGRMAVPRMRRDPLVNKSVHIIDGEYKGCGGTIKSVYKGNYIVTLKLKHESITVPMESVSFDSEKPMPYEATGRIQGYKDIGYKDTGYKDVGYKTPGYQTPGYKTPGYQTPGYKTPGYQTPGYQTPGYKTPGYQTPGYKTPGYKTPGYQTPGYRTPGLKTPNNRFGYTEDAGTDWLSQQSKYDGTLISVNGTTISLSDVNNNVFIDKHGKSHDRKDISFVTPQKYDNVIILDGPQAGTEGALVTINGETGTVKTAGGEAYTVKITAISKKASNRF